VARAHTAEHAVDRSAAAAPAPEPPSTSTAETAGACPATEAAAADQPEPVAPAPLPPAAESPPTAEASSENVPPTTTIEGAALKRDLTAVEAPSGSRLKLAKRRIVVPPSSLGSEEASL